MIRFGFDSNEVAAVAEQVGAACGVVFETRWSEWRGGSYRRADLEIGTIFVLNNQDPVDGTPYDDDWPSGNVVLYMDGMSDSDWMHYRRQIVESALGIRATELPPV